MPKAKEHITANNNRFPENSWVGLDGPSIRFIGGSVGDFCRIVEKSYGGFSSGLVSALSRLSFG